MTRVAILHTHPATVEPLTAVAAEVLPGVELIHVVDATIYADLQRTGGLLDSMATRLVSAAQQGAQAGADAILSACSSIGEFVPQAQAAVAVPVVRIDATMAAAAVRRGSVIGIAATLASTLAPTTRLLQAAADEAGRAVTLQPVLITGAFERLTAGDRAGHDALLVVALSELAQRSDVVVLAQVSMARVLPALSEADRAKCLTSPRLGLEAVRAALVAGVTA